jgi:hypothetical protein
MSKLSRRTLVSSAAALPALTVPALADVIDHPDAELLQLGDQLAVVEREWEAMAVEFQRRSQIFEAARERAGLPDRNYNDFENYDQFIEYNRKLHALWPESDSDLDREAETNNFVERKYAIIEKILSLKATTIAGLAVQARAIVLDNAEFWDRGAMKSEKEAPELRRQRQFLELTCSFLGIEPAPIRLRLNV